MTDKLDTKPLIDMMRDQLDAIYTPMYSALYEALWEKFEAGELTEQEMEDAYQIACKGGHGTE